jgi:protein-S-isoprenylcysteine O-methyltransferase Ste14
MADLPLGVLTATVWAYWFCVGFMIVRIRRKSRKLVGLVPEQKLERRMWLIWVPLVVLWATLPWLAQRHLVGPLALPEFARGGGLYGGVRIGAAVVAVVCLVQTIRCWIRMGSDWRMEASRDNTNLITDGLFRHIRHPIYAFSVLLMLSSAVILPSLPMLAVAAVHVLLMNIKARNEERHMLQSHGEAYARYLARTGRFFPRLGK